MRMVSVMSLSAALGAIVLLPAAIKLTAPPEIPVRPTACTAGTGPAGVACADSEPQDTAAERPLPAGDAPAFLLASVQPIKAPAEWRAIYQQVERCAGMDGDY